MKSSIKYSICLVAIILLIPGFALATTLDHDISYNSGDVSTESDSCFYRVYMKGCCGSSNEMGMPDLPYDIIQLIIPRAYTVDSVVITEIDTAHIGKYLAMPVQDTSCLNDTIIPDFIPPDSATYTSSTPYPTEIIE